MIFIEDPSNLYTTRSLHYSLFSMKDCDNILEHYSILYQALLLALRIYNWEYGFLFTISRETLVFEQLVHLCKGKLMGKFNLTPLQIYLLLSRDEIRVNINPDEIKTEKNKLIGVLNLCAALYGIQFFWKNSLQKETSKYMIKHWVNDMGVTEDEARSRQQDFKKKVHCKMNQLVSLHTAGFLYILANPETFEIELSLCKIPNTLKHLILETHPIVIELDCLYVPESLVLHRDPCTMREIIRVYTQLI